MAENKVNPDNYIVVQGWMLTELHLKGNELLIFAILYGYTNGEGRAFTGSLQYLADWTNSTKQGVQKALKALLDKGYIKKDSVQEGVYNKVAYYTTKLHTPYNKVVHPIQQSCTNNIEHNIEDNIVIMQRRKNRGKKKTASIYDEYANANAKKQLDEWRAKNEGR